MPRILSSKKTIVLDGASGTRLKARHPDLSSEEISIKDPDLVYSIHRGYVDAGARVILTNTFGVNPRHYDKKQLSGLIKESVAIAKKATGKRNLVAGDIGPSGRLPEPYGDYKIKDMISDFSSVAAQLLKSGVDLLYLESFTTIIEARAALLAAKGFKRPVFVTLTFDDTLRTPFGDLPESCALILEGLGADAVGVNCTTPEIVIDVLKRMAEVTSLPLIAKPNAGLPVGDRFTYGTKKMVSFIPELTGVADLVGGCCGTTPDFIREISRKKRIRKKRRIKKVLALTSPVRMVRLDQTILVGERINPTGRKRLTRALKEGDYQFVAHQARKQEDSGAEAIDVNLFVPNLNEKKSMAEVVNRLITQTTAPIFIDTRDFQAAEEALIAYPGVCVINSVPVVAGELKKWLPLARRFGAYVVISLSGKKLPAVSDDRIRFYKQAKRVAKGLRFPTDHLIYDPLVFPIATAPKQINETLRTVARLKGLGELTILGISNVSYGMPDRPVLNAVLVANAIKAGVGFIIANPFDQKVKDAIIGSAILFEGKRIRPKEKKSPEDLQGAIVAGDKKLTCDLVEKKKGNPIMIIDNEIIPALNLVGEKYEKGEFFLPQLMTSAQAAKAAMEILKKRIGKGKGKGKGGTVVLATVAGDIHDLGKNIVKVILESHGFTVYDLGVNVPTKRIIRAIRDKRAKVLGLSALMTTTMGRMTEVVEELRRRKIRVEVVVGGAPIDEGFARKIGVHYASNAVSGVKIIKRLFDVSKEA